MISKPLNTLDAAEKQQEKISPFLLLLMNTMATQLGGSVDLKRHMVETDCGFMTLSLAGEDIIYVNRLMINPDRQGEGCGTAFLEALEMSIARISHQTMYIQLWPVKSATGFYLKNGYKLHVYSSEDTEYRDLKRKKYGDNWKQYAAKVRVQIRETDGDEWTHESLWAQYEKSDLFTPDQPLFYSFYVSDIADGSYEYAQKVVHPSPGVQKSSAV